MHCLADRITVLTQGASLLHGDKRIKDVTLKTPWQAPDLPLLKETILDIKALDHRGVTFFVEMQVKDQPCFDKRALYYTAKAYTAQIHKGDDTPKLNQVISAFTVGVAPTCWRT